MNSGRTAARAAPPGTAALTGWAGRTRACGGVDGRGIRRHASVEEVLLTHEGRDVGGGRRAVDRVGVGELLDASLAHDRDAVAHRERLALVVRDEDERDAESRLDELELELHLFAQLAVEGAERLVQQQDGRAVDECACERDPLLLAAGELGGLAIGEAAHLHHVERGGHALAHLGLGRAALLQAVGHVLGHAHVREQRVRLEHRVDVAAVGRGAEHALSGDADVAGIRLFESGDHPQCRRLPAAGRAEQRDELAGLDREGQIIDRELIAVALGDALQRDGAVRVGRAGDVGLADGLDCRCHVCNPAFSRAAVARPVIQYRERRGCNAALAEPDDPGDAGDRCDRSSGRM